MLAWGGSISPEKLLALHSDTNAPAASSGGGVQESYTFRPQSGPASQGTSSYLNSSGQPPEVQHTASTTTHSYPPSSSFPQYAPTSTQPYQPSSSPQFQQYVTPPAHQYPPSPAPSYPLSAPPAPPPYQGVPSMQRQQHVAVPPSYQYQQQPSSQSASLLHSNDVTPLPSYNPPHSGGTQQRNDSHTVGSSPPFAPSKLQEPGDPVPPPDYSGPCAPAPSLSMPTPSPSSKRNASRFGYGKSPISSYISDKYSGGAK